MTLRFLPAMGIFLAFVTSAFAQAPPPNQACEKLASLSFPQARITGAQAFAAGTFRLPEGAGRARFDDTPAFCRVAATLTPSSDSDIKIEVWLPVSGWNGKLLAVGNGGWGGVINYNDLKTAVVAGYAGASTDTGHSENSGKFALGHPEKLIDYGQRAVHEMTVKSKALIAAYYGSAPKHSYWNGCSLGGRQGLKEAQQYPSDFDGIVAGAAANPATRLNAAQIWMALVANKDESSFLPPSKYDMLHRAVVEACDALDGVKDGLIENPTRCHFDPKTLQCRSGDSPECLTPAQVAAVREIYGGSRNPRTKGLVFPALQPGSESGWKAFTGHEAMPVATDTFRYVVFKNPAWDWRTLDLDSDVALADKVDNENMNATKTDLSAFFGHGGKLLLYHGWSDPGGSPLNTVNYYNDVVDKAGGRADFVRLFLLPGMGHCEGGEGPDTFDKVRAVASWVESGNAPERIVAAHLTGGKVDRTRPLCPYPQVARYTGSGSIDEAANFTCSPDGADSR